MAGTDKAAELYAFVKEYAQLKLEAETKRYESLIQQASNMQAAFFVFNCSIIYGGSNRY